MNRSATDILSSIAAPLKRIPKSILIPGLVAIGLAGVETKRAVSFLLDRSDMIERERERLDSYLKNCERLKDKMGSFDRREAERKFALKEMQEKEKAIEAECLAETLIIACGDTKDKALAACLIENLRPNQYEATEKTCHEEALTKAYDWLTNEETKIDARYEKELSDIPETDDNLDYRILSFQYPERCKAFPVRSSWTWTPGDTKRLKRALVGDYLYNRIFDQ